MIDRELRIAYISVDSPDNPLAWSGTHYHIFKALAKHYGEVFYLEPLPLYVDIFRPIFKLIQKTLELVINGAK